MISSSWVRWFTNDFHERYSQKWKSQVKVKWPHYLCHNWNTRYHSGYGLSKERGCYYVTPLIDWVRTQNDPRSTMYFYLVSIKNLNLNKKSLLTLSQTLVHFLQSLLCFKHTNPVKTKIACSFHHCQQRQPILTQYYNVAQMWGIGIVEPSGPILLTSVNRHKMAVH